MVNVQGGEGSAVTDRGLGRRLPVVSVLGALGTGSGLAVRLPGSTAVATLRGCARVRLVLEAVGSAQPRQGR